MKYSSNCDSQFEDYDTGSLSPSAAISASSSVALVAIHSDSQSQGKPLGVALASLLQSQEDK